MFKGIRLIRLLLVLGASISMLSACSPTSDYHSKSATLKQVVAVGAVPQRVSLPQGWSSETKQDFWFTSQGSRIVPYSWFTWIEQPDNQNFFRDAAHMEMLRYLPMESSSANPAGLPIGFVAAHDDKSGEAWVGMTCAACHTNQIDYNGNKMLVDGAPTLGNFVLFYQRLVEALNETQKDNAKFERFAKNVLGEAYNGDTATSLRQKLTSVSLAAAERLAVNDLPASFPKNFTSYARLDAFGNIQNAGTAFALNDLSNKNVPSGPVSYPFLWGTHQSDVVQWNASAPNTPVIGPLARNVGEVIGVFGGLEMKEAKWWERLIGKKISYSSHADITGLGYLESMVKTLQSPVWPSDYLPAIDVIKAGQGKVLFAESCEGCHQVIARSDEGSNYKAIRTPVKEVGTDPVTAINADRNCAKTLVLEGTKEAILLGKKFAAESAAISIPVNGAVGVILNHPATSLKAGLKPMRTHFSVDNGGPEPLASSASSTDDETDDNVSAVDDHKKSLEEHLSRHLKEIDKMSSNSVADGSCGDPDATLVYKARPLNGIWATAPYLHNGSVPSLWALLQAGPSRPDRFWVGSRRFDPIKVGYVSDVGLNEFKVNDDQGKIQPGNSNEGHEYGTDWSDEEKWAVVEYMKTL